jgi:NAD(P)-dependent dehydrogenase (short-subunit alcohol dehydrogenase family)
MAGIRGVAILVGAGDAIGAAVARHFAKDGYTVCICRRDAAKSQGLVDELKATGLDAHAFTVDARQEAEVQKLFADVERALTDRVCLFNAGSNVNKPLLDTTEKLLKAWNLRYGGFLVGREAARKVRGRAVRSSLPERPPASVAARGLRHSRRRNSDFARWPRPWPANSGPRISTSCIS